MQKPKVRAPTERRAERLSRAQGLVGRTLRGKWRLDSILGMGGMGAVFAATHRNGFRGAIKILHPELAADNICRTRFLREGYVANKFSSGVVSILDDDVDEDGSVYLVMELLDGLSVGELVRVMPGRRLPLARVAQLGLDLLQVLEEAHRMGVLHRDIKPDNLFMTKTGELRVLDFGVAFVPREAGDANRWRRLTSSSSALGTPSYMAPEQAICRWSQVGARSDNYSAGATLFALVAGRPPHVAETPGALNVAVATLQAPSLGTIAPHLPPAFVEVIDRSLRFHQEERFESAADMRRALEATELAARTPYVEEDWKVDAGARDVARSSGSSRPTVRPNPISPGPLVGTAPGLGSAIAAGTRGSSVRKEAAPNDFPSGSDEASTGRRGGTEVSNGSSPASPSPSPSPSPAPSLSGLKNLLADFERGIDLPSAPVGGGAGQTAVENGSVQDYSNKVEVPAQVGSPKDSPRSDGALATPESAEPVAEAPPGAMLGHRGTLVMEVSPLMAGLGALATDAPGASRAPVPEGDQRRVPSQPEVVGPSPRIPSQPDVVGPTSRIPSQPEVMVPSVRVPSQPEVIAPSARVPSRPDLASPAFPQASQGPQIAMVPQASQASPPSQGPVGPSRGRAATPFDLSPPQGPLSADGPAPSLDSSPAPPRTWIGVVVLLLGIAGFAAALLWGWRR